MIFLFNNEFCYPLSYCSDEEFNKLNWFKRTSYKLCMKRALKHFKYDKISKFICSEDSIRLCLKLSTYMRNPTIIDMDGISYLSNSDYWEENYGLSTK